MPFPGPLWHFVVIEPVIRDLVAQVATDVVQRGLVAIRGPVPTDHSEVGQQPDQEERADRRVRERVQLDGAQARLPGVYGHARSEHRGDESEEEVEALLSQIFVPPEGLRELVEVS